MKIIKGIKLRLYPNEKQTNQLWQMFGNSRFVWNQMLAMAKKRYESNPGSSFINEYGMNYLLKPLKQEYPFLKLSDSMGLQTINHNLALAFKRLFHHQGGYPHFKSRRMTVQSYCGKSSCRVLAKRRMQLPKIGSIRTSKTGQLQGVKIKRYTVSHDAADRYYLTMQVETEVPEMPKTGKKIGIDVGVADLAIASDGTKYKTFNARFQEKQVKVWQSEFGKRKNRAKIAVRQWNHNHKISKMELDDYRNWQKARVVKSRYQAKSIANASWSKFRSMLEYKCEWYGKQLVAVNPCNTSRICSNCGFNSGAKPLEVREWTCPKCGTHHDRDVNAAVNILNRGLKAIG